VSSLLSYTSVVIMVFGGKVWSVYIHKLNRIMRCRDTVTWISSKWPPVAILDLLQLEIVLFDLPTLKTPPKNQTLQTWRRSDDQMMCCRVMAIWNVAKCVNGPWVRSSVVRGHQCSYFLLMSYTPLSIRCKRSVRGVKISKLGKRQEEETDEIVRWEIKANVY